MEMLNTPAQDSPTAAERRPASEPSDLPGFADSAEVRVAQSFLHETDRSDVVAGAADFPCNLCTRDLYRQYGSLGYVPRRLLSGDRVVPSVDKAGNGDVEKGKGSEAEGSEVLCLMLRSGVSVEAEEKQREEKDAGRAPAAGEGVSQETKVSAELSKEDETRGRREETSERESGHDFRPAFPFRRLFMFRPSRDRVYRGGQQKQSTERRAVEGGLERKASGPADGGRRNEEEYKQLATETPLLALEREKVGGAQERALAKEGNGDKKNQVEDSRDRTQCATGEREKPGARLVNQAGLKPVALFEACDPAGLSAIDWVPSSALGRPWDFHEDGHLCYSSSRQELFRGQTTAGGLECIDLKENRVRRHAPASGGRAQSPSNTGGQNAFDLCVSTSYSRSSSAGKVLLSGSDPRDSRQAKVLHGGDSGSTGGVSAADRGAEGASEVPLRFQLSEDEDALCVPLLFRTRIPGLVQVRAVLEFPLLQAKRAEENGFQTGRVEGDEDVFLNGEPQEDSVSASCCILAQKPLEVQLQPAPFATACIHSRGSQTVPSSSAVYSSGEGERCLGGVRPVVYVHVKNPSSVALQLKDVHLEPFPSRDNGSPAQPARGSSAENAEKRTNTSPGEPCGFALAAANSCKQRCPPVTAWRGMEVSTLACSKEKRGGVTAGDLPEATAKPYASSRRPADRRTSAKACPACGAALGLAPGATSGRRRECGLGVAGEDWGVPLSMTDFAGIAVGEARTGVRKHEEERTGCSAGQETKETELLAWPLIGRLQSVGGSESWSALVDLRGILTGVLKSDEARQKVCEGPAGMDGSGGARRAGAQQEYCLPGGYFAVRHEMHRWLGGDCSRARERTPDEVTGGLGQGGSCVQSCVECKRGRSMLVEHDRSLEAFREVSRTPRRLRESET